MYSDTHSIHLTLQGYYGNLTFSSYFPRCFLNLGIIEGVSHILIIYRGVSEISGPFIDEVLAQYKSYHHINNSLSRQDDLFIFCFLFETGQVMYILKSEVKVKKSPLVSSYKPLQGSAVNSAC